MSIAMLTAAAFKTAPKKKLNAPYRILTFLPIVRVTYDAANVETKPAKYSEDVKRVRSWLSYLQ
ncbi:hypothetical protein ACHQM5_028754 [Ranunculus cassubicifolius]